MPNADRARVAELIVTGPTGAWRGSGYRVTTGSVLTAAHVVRGATRVEVRFLPDLPGSWSVRARVAWTHDGTDLAVLAIDAPDTVPNVEFGVVDWRRAAVLAAHAVGFPRWKLRTDDDGSKFRDAHQATGTVATLSHWRSDTLEFTVPVPPEAVAVGSPWEGMSGAAVWVDGAIVGVLARHHHSDGPGRLTASRVNYLGGAQSLVGYPDVPRDVVPQEPAQVVSAAYRDELKTIAPVQLFDRVDELDELVRFCAGPDPYQWWQAGPWAGKSALLSWFALNPPAGVDVVSFFITSRYVGQSDSDAFLDAVLEQLAALVGESPSAVLHARAGQLRRLIEAAAARAESTGRRLVLVVDGLDEDTSGAARKPSIAGLLPESPPPGLRVLVASRPYPSLPKDVRASHPLHALVPIQLSVAEAADDLARAANDELDTLFEGPNRDVLGLITASGGGLTLDDLHELTHLLPYDLERLFTGLFGRSIRGRVSSLGQAPVHVYLFAHETLRVTAEALFGPVVADFRAQLHDWADGYRARGWPAETPVYLLRGYSRMLAAANDRSRLLALVTDARRRDRMLDHSGGDALTTAELTTAATRFADPPDLAALLVIAYAKNTVVYRNIWVPDHLPAVWESLGERDRAVALAEGTGRIDAYIEMIRSATDEDRATALFQHALAISAGFDQGASQATRLLEALSVALNAGVRLSMSEVDNLLDRAERLVENDRDPAQVACGLARLARDAARLGWTARVRPLIERLDHSRLRTREFLYLAEALWRAGHQDAARVWADQARDEVELVPLLDTATVMGDAADAIIARIMGKAAEDPAEYVELCEALIRAGRPELTARMRIRVGSLEREIPTINLTLRAMVESSPQRARELATQAEQAARSTTDPKTRINLLITVGRLVTAPELAFRLADSASRMLSQVDVYAYDRITILAQLSTLLTKAGRDGTAFAEEACQGLRDDDYHNALRLAGAFQAGGDLARAENLIRRHESYRFKENLASLAVDAAKHGDRQLVHRLIPEVVSARFNGDDVDSRVYLLIRAHIALGELDLAQDATRSLTDHSRRIWAWSLIAQAAPRDLALTCATTAEDLAMAIPNMVRRAISMDSVVKALAAAGEPERALHHLDATLAVMPDFAQELGESHRHDTIVDLALGAAMAHDLPRAESLLQTVPPSYRKQTLASLADVLLTQDCRADAVRLLAEALNAGEFHRALPVVAEADPGAVEALAEHLLR
ncbi:trypsin-like peptidase domain-containing protein [Actinokineospora inagensis]|uniref:trypsin-like peptidase domain-containing protein n=1 Tax=Actinokineospora inagensis TaxID=103730 RepID=UPI0003FD6FCF|nr:trypsin-like peptidase domain-containing protein [Actinokineospora inagensis]